MNYPYSVENLLDKPHNYMYAPYGGHAFLSAYVEDRLARLFFHVPRLASPLPGDLKNMLTSEAQALASEQQPEDFSTDEPTQLQPLLRSILSVLGSGDHAAAKPWLARIIQRFEVSKKLYASYAPGFRKGDGDASTPIRYAELALCLALAYLLSGHLQYLSTLLKLNDLLLSIDKDALRSACSPNFMALLVFTELDAITRLAAAQGVTINAP